MAKKKPGGGQPTADDTAVWRYAMRGTAPRRWVGQRPQNLLPPDPLAHAPPWTRPPAMPASLPEPPPPGVGLDKRSARRLKRGRAAIDGRLDLHGMTLDQAHGALDRFLDRADRAGKRCLLVITGKGRGDGERPLGVLRDAVPRWLQVGVNRQRVLAVEPARPQHGGDGALYVLLRRKRT